MSHPHPPLQRNGKARASRGPDGSPWEHDAEMVRQILAGSREHFDKRSSGRLNAPVLQVMKPGWHEEAKKRLAADGKPVFQAKDVHLDAKQDFQPEPENVEVELEKPPE